MKRIYNIAICCIAVCFLAACSKEYDFSEVPAGGDGNSIILDISSSALPVSRATVKAEGAEVAVSHIDVLIFDDTDAKKLVWSDRVSAPANQSGLITLATKRETFGANTKYWVYLIANSTHPKEDFKNLVDLNALKAMTQQDENIHMTGVKSEGHTFPATFLMDGIAYPEGVEEPALDAVAPVVLNDGVNANDTELKVTLRRAAAKIVVTITKGDDVTFDDAPQSHAAGYYLRNMPYSTSIVAGVDGQAKLKNTDKTSGGYFNWNSDKITVTAYMYAHAWDNASSLEQEVRLVMNIPLTYNKDNDAKLRPNNYYQVPVCRGKAIDRNTCYMVTAKVNAPGAENPSTPVTLTDVEFSVVDWVNETINVGGDDGRPTFLTLNQYDLEMRNMEDDHTSLIFTSSSDVTAKVTGAYYYNKFGVKTNVANDILRKISATPDPGLTGHIDIYSPLPDNNTIRYIEVTVTNADGIERKLTIEQYPLEYITNIQGWYSYRSDFGGTNYENKGPNAYVAAVSYKGGKWTYSSSTQSGFFRSIVATLKNNGSGASTLQHYYWSKNSVEKDNAISSRTNARMYFVRITASSGEYTLGRPRITNGITDPGADNAQLVSPSFMIASQLGMVYSEPTGTAMAASHCENYVEVYKDKNGRVVHLNDWRLPTEAELKIIKKFQGQSDAIDIVLTGNYYYSASGSIYVGGGQQGTFLRCIRDAYDDESIYEQ